jgi:uncharacterized surface protein with fasciclin (FAS1) repeats
MALLVWGAILDGREANGVIHVVNRVLIPPAG